MGTGYESLTFPHQHQIVLIDTSRDLASMKPLERIPLSFWIDFNDAGVVNPPQLTMLINPQTMSHGFTKKRNESYTRGGFVREEWGENLDVLSLSGKIGAYYVKEAEVGFSGLNRYERNKSLSFKNLYNLFMIYRSNGSIYQTTSRGSKGARDKLMQFSGYTKINKRVPNIVQSSKNRIDKVGDVYMYFDGTIYIGSFDNFSIEETADSPYTLKYDFQFTVHYRTKVDTKPYINYEQLNNHLEDIYKTREDYKSLRRVERSAINTETIARAEELNNIAPKSLNDNYTNKNVPSKATLSHVRYLESNGFTVDTSDRILINEQYKRASEGVYKDNLKLVHNLREINHNIVKKTIKDEGKSWSISNNITDINILNYSNIKARAK